MSEYFNKKFHNINHLGHIPFNPDLFLNKGRFFDRPVGLSFQEFTKLYWTVKSFKVSLVLTSFNEVDAFTAFVAGGGASAGIAGATAGLAGVAASIAGQAPIILNGYTKIITRYEKTIRKDTTNSSPFEGFSNGSLEKKDKWFEKDPEISKNPLVSTNKKPNEASLCSAGPVHKIQRGASYLSIDFSDVIFFRRLYWPKIQFVGSSNNLGFSFNPSRSQVNVNVIGGISFLGALIPFYGFSESFTIIPSSLVVAFGSIDIGKRCCDRFFYDGSDEEREKDEKCQSVCGDGTNGVFEPATKLVASTQQSNDSGSKSIRGSSTSIGGGGKFGGGGASASF